MALIDISVPLHINMPIWPGSEGFSLKQTMSLGNGDEANVNSLACDIHTGSHVESSIHFIEDGKTIDNVPLDIFCGPALVVDLEHLETIKELDLSSINLPEGVKRILLKTKNSKLWKEDGNLKFIQDFVALSSDAAKWLVDKKINLVGIDYLSIQHYNDASEVHKTLLEGGVMILEGLNLAAARPGKYELIALPLKIMGAEGSPVRAVLRSISEITPNAK